MYQNMGKIKGITIVLSYSQSSTFLHFIPHHIKKYSHIIFIENQGIDNNSFMGYNVHTQYRQCKGGTMDITIWDALATIGLVLFSYVFGYYRGKSITSTPNFSENTNPYYNKDTNTYSVPFQGSLEGMPYPGNKDNQ